MLKPQILRKRRARHVNPIFFLSFLLPVPFWPEVQGLNRLFLDLLIY